MDQTPPPFIPLGAPRLRVQPQGHGLHRPHRLERPPRHAEPHLPAWRAQVGVRGLYKAGLAVLPDGRLLASPFGVAAVVSDDAGQTWDHDGSYQLAWSKGGCTGWATTRQLADGALVTIHALEPYDVEPAATGRTVCHTVRWHLPPRA